MRKILLISAVAAALALTSTPVLKNVNAVKEERDATIIVKMKSKMNPQTMRLEQDSLLNQISTEVTPNFRVKTRYTNIFNGFVLDVPSSYVSQIRNLSRVADVNYNSILEEFTSGDGVNYEISLSTGKTASSKTMEKPDGTNDGSGTFVAILDNGFYIQQKENSQVLHEVFKPLDAADAVLTQSALKAKIDAAGDKFHGKYDETHSTYFNSKVPFYYDYGGDTQGKVAPDYDVYAEGQDHGTHVASIAGGNAGENKYQGIAPKAQMALMKVFTTYMSGQEYKSGAYKEAVLTALEDCLVLGVDAINMSLGSNLDDFDDNTIVEQTIRQLESKGTFVCVAAGNEGKGQWKNNAYRYWGTDMMETGILSGYANNSGAMTVASTQADEQFYGVALFVDKTNVQFEDQVVNYKSTSGDVIYTPERHLTDLVTDYGKSEFEYVEIPGYGETKDYSGLNVTGKIAVVKRGSTTFKEKVQEATKAGAIAMICINNESTKEINIKMSFGDNFTPAIPVAFIIQDDGAHFTNDTTKKCTIIQNQDLENPQARTISDYSSDGMKYDLSIKPEISTPGENIKGAILGATDAYESMSGTSMATPNYCGAVALMISNHLTDENSADYRKTINARLMSTAQPMTDLTTDENHSSVRRQGAGLVNLDGAINSKVYLDGLDAENKPLGKAKIELKNNDDIKQGKVALKFAAINEGSQAVTYKATTYVYAPKIEEYNEEQYPDLAGSKFQAIDDQLVVKYEENVTINPGTQVITLTERNIDANKLAALDADFDAGCILEGYVILTANEQKQLSIPFLGYYGDLDNVAPVEDFTFEREEGKLYSSDLLNYLITQSLIDKTYSKADYRSYMLTGYFSNYKNIKLTDAVLNNTTNVTKLLDENGTSVKSVGLNPYTGEYDKENLFVGNNNASNVLIIQQYVTRSVNTNTITLKKKSNGQVVATEHLEDSMFGPTRDGGNPIPIAYPLYKSHFDSTYFDQGYMAHRAFGIVPMYKIDSKKNVTTYDEGEYELIMSYELAYGNTFVKKYNLTIQNSKPALSNVDDVETAGAKAVRFSYTAQNLSSVSVNGDKYAPTKDGDKYYVDVPTSKYVNGDNDTVYVVASDLAYAKDSYITRLNDKNHLMVYHQLFNSAIYSYKYTVENEGTNNQVYTFSFTKNGSDYNTKGDIAYSMRVPEGLELATLKLYAVTVTGESEIKYTADGNFISFKTAVKTIRFVSEGGVAPGPVNPEPSEPDKQPSKSGCGADVASVSAMFISVTLLGTILVSFKKRFIRK